MSTAEIVTYLLGQECARQSAEELAGITRPGTYAHLDLTADQEAALASLGEQKWAYWLLRGSQDWANEHQP